ncbi:uncharacterized protein ACJ7VT_011829 [Polymixia lowei]
MHPCKQSDTSPVSPPLEGMSSRKRRPNWTDQECLLLAQLMEERKDIIRGKCSTGVSIQDKRQAWEEIAQAINTVFPQFRRTVSDCNKKWENLLAKSREEIKRQKMQLGRDEDPSPEQFSDVTQIVISVMNLSDRLVQDSKDPSILQLVEDQQCFDNDENNHSTGETSKGLNSDLTEIGLPECTASPTIRLGHFTNPSTPPTTHKMDTFSDASNSLAVHFNSPSTAASITPVMQFNPCTTTPPSIQCTTLQERMDLEMSVLRRQEAVLKLQEEYYTLKIKLMKKQMGGLTHKRLK